MQILSPSDVDHFLTYGFVVVPDCFCRDTARQWTDRAFERLGYDPHDPGTWKEPRIHLMEATLRPDLAQFSPRAWGAACDLLGGAERIQSFGNWGDAFIFNFRDGADRPWEGPDTARTNWHVDGNWFRHFLDSPEQALLTFSVWSDIEHQGGGTFIAPDSIPGVARYLADHPEGTRLHDIPFPQIMAGCRDRRELTGRVGDVIFCHPFLLHANSQNVSGRPRIINNPTIRLKEPFCLSRADPSDYSLVERATLRALGAERFPFTPAQLRERYETGT
jgi:hypothetical protein